MGAVNVGYIGADGKYRKGEDQPMGYDVNITHKEWRHDYERKQFAREIIQPRVDGKPNPAFILAYPGYSKKYFTQEQIDEALRQLP